MPFKSPNEKIAKKVNQQQDLASVCTRIIGSERGRVFFQQAASEKEMMSISVGPDQSFKLVGSMLVRFPDPLV